MQKSEARTDTNLFNLGLIRKNSPLYQHTTTTKAVPPFVVPTPRPQVLAVHGTCGHVARSANHTCGSYYCD